ncbi:MAG: hypothetical protein B6U89_07505 [Desulfurococcales archaeon ex4484_58]|nr:MAG: hypothetical protein B6U89_07505 [Desulfurococcales archaeon ex4484_58]
MEIYGRGEHDRLKRIIQGFLEKNNIGFRVKSYGRITVYRIGFMKNIKLIYNYSDGSFKIICPKNYYEALKKELIINGFRVFELTKYLESENRYRVEDQVFELLLKKQELKHKVKYAREDLLLSIPLMFIIYLIFYYNKVTDQFTIFIVLAILLTIYLIVPRKRIYSTIWYIPLEYPIYRREYRRILDNIKELSKTIPRNSEYRGIIEFLSKKHI